MKRIAAILIGTYFVTSWSTKQFVQTKLNFLNDKDYEQMCIANSPPDVAIFNSRADAEKFLEMRGITKDYAPKVFMIKSVDFKVPKEENERSPK